jgi:hypothetical protein
MGAEYADLVAVLNSTINTGLYKIDILPDGHSLPHNVNIWVEDFNISIPKRALKKAFISAREIFFANVDTLKMSTSSQGLVLDASAVILLVAPEYLTAANARKRVIMAWSIHSKEKGQKGIMMELSTLDSMLMSPLNKHTKSPTLWAHRRWLLKKLPRPEPIQPERGASIPQLRKEREISIVGLTAAQHHPRNYYAWDHIRWWISYNPDLLDNFGQCDISQCSPAKPPFGLPKLAKVIQRWCLNHPSDTSGWSFLLWLLTVPGTLPSEKLHLRGPFNEVAHDVLINTGTLKLRKEAVWVFLRTLIASDDMAAEVSQRALNDARTISVSENERLESKLIAERVIKWLEKRATVDGLYWNDHSPNMVVNNVAE